MSQTKTREALFTSCVQDLHAGELLLVERLPDILDYADDPPLRDILKAQITQSRLQAERLRASGEDVAGPPNLWMAGILDDAHRDTQSIVPGSLLDVALIGAIRKAKAAEIVSYETAVATAEVVGNPAAAICAAILQEERTADAALHARLIALSS